MHGVGATLYYDGANLNAVMGIVRPGDTGFDIVHFNLHKTFTQPHGGGGPGAGPIPSRTGSSPSCRCRGSVPAVPLAEPTDPATDAVNGPVRGGEAAAERSSTSTSTTQVDRQAAASRPATGVFVRSYAYIRSLGRDGLEEASRVAVLNANYLRARLAGRDRRVPADRVRPPAHARAVLRPRRPQGARHQDARHRQAHARPRRAPRRASACWSTRRS